MKHITWFLEPEVFGKNYKEFEAEIKSAGHNIVYWNDDYITPEQIPASLRFVRLATGPVVFHGSLGTTYRIFREWMLTPGTFGNPKQFECTSYYPNALSWRLNQEYIISTVEDVCNSNWIKQWQKELPLDIPEKVFIRPSSPLKQFSGRVLNINDITPKALDYGFYYDYLNLSIVIAPVKQITREWRFVVVNNKVITGSSYIAATRSYNKEDIEQKVWQYASEIAEKMPQPSPVYVLDICDSEEGLRLLELNPFSGADLYGCDFKKIVEAVSNAAIKLYE